MKKLVGGLAIAVAMLLPGAAFAGSSTDAALGLGAFAVFNQILGGIGIFGRPARRRGSRAGGVRAAARRVRAAAAAGVRGTARVVYAPAPPVFVRPAPGVRATRAGLRAAGPGRGHGRGHGNPHWQRTQWGHRGW